MKIDDGVLAEAILAVPRFRAEWHRTSWFGEDVLWLAPKPESSFRALTTTVWRAFPDYPPYEGQFDDVVPHLTVGHTASPEGLRAVEREVQAHLPVSMDVSVVQLMCGTTSPSSWRTIAELPLGNSDYTRYGLWLCQDNVAAGEDIRYLRRDRAPDLPDHDYWLFDSTRLYVVRFDEQDDLLGAEPVDDRATVLQHCFWRDAAWHYATPYVEYLEAAGSAVEHPASP